LVQGVIPQLESLYQSDKAVEQKRQEKAALIENLREQYQVLKTQWGDYDAYDNWFASDINNAKLRTVSTYFNRVPAFDALLAEVDYDLPLFYERVEELSRLESVEREAAIARLAP